MPTKALYPDPPRAPWKLVDASGLTDLGWRAKIGLTEELSTTYADFIAIDGRA